jgi:O-succinylbenzoate synthase
MRTCTADQLAASSGPIRIERVEAWRVAIPMHEPFRISSGEVSRKEAVIVRIHDGEAFGWGESSAMPGAFYSTDTPDSCQQALVERVLPAITGRTFRTRAELESFLLAQSQSGFVRVAVETAAWELVARRQGVSLRSLFGIADRPVPSGLAVGLYDSIGELRDALERYRAREYSRVKIKIKRGHDVELVRNVREWLGSFPLFVDANADYARADIPVFEELDRYELMMFEQPLAKDDVETAAELQRRVRTPVCFDEGAETAVDVRRALDLDACRIINIKIQRVGGYLESLRIVEMCQAAGIPVWMGTMPELGIGSAQALMLAAHPAFQFPTDVEPSDRWYTDDILEPALQLRDRCLGVPNGPGLGSCVNMAALERYATAHWQFP